MIKPESIAKITIYGEQQRHYGYHYHIVFDPAISPSKIYDLLLENLKALLGAKQTEKKGVEHKIIVDAESFQVRAQNRRDPTYSERLLKIGGRDRIHISIERDEGMTFLIEAVKLGFPNVKIIVKEVDPTELEAQNERWRSIGDY